MKIIKLFFAYSIIEVLIILILFGSILAGLSACGSKAPNKMGDTLFHGFQNQEKHIDRLFGEIDQEWLKSVGESLPANQVEYVFREAQGFKDTAPEARKQALLNQPWFFYQNIDDEESKPSEVQIPHHFDKNRKYNSAWYFSKYKLDKPSDKRLILKLNRIDLFSMIYVNDKRIGHHFGSYTPFEFDITEAIVPGENVLAIFVYDRSAAVDKDKAYNQLGPAWLKSSYSQGRADEILPGGIDDIPILEVRNYATIDDVFVKTSTRKRTMEIEYNLSFDNNSLPKSKLSFEVLKWPEGEKVDLKIPDIILKQPVNGVQSCQIKWSNPDFWSPDHPNLYVLRTTLENGKNSDVVETRFGFREFWVEGKNFMLNGIPIRLRGESIYRPMGHGVGIHRENFEKYKEIYGSNACRIHAYMPHGDIMKAADEAGVLLINQSAIWSVNVLFYKNGGNTFLKNVEKEFEEWVKRDRNSPSVVIWDVENEMLRYNYELHLPWVSKLPEFIMKYDNTRPFNFSGGGWFSADQDMISLHMQEHYTRIMKDWKQKGTKPLLMGEFWVGGRMEQRLTTSPELNSVDERYVEEAKIYEERLLEMRYLGVSGVMPFRIGQLSFIADKKYSQNNLNNRSKLHKVPLRSDEVLRRIKHGLQPVSLFFWPRQNYVSSNETFQRELIICNDGETADSFEITWKFEGQPEMVKTIELLPATQEKFVIVERPPLKPSNIIATVRNKEGLISSDTLLINPIQVPKLTIGKKIQIYKDENLARTLTHAGFKSVSVNTFPGVKDNVLLIIPEHANNRELNSHKVKILDFLSNGGSVLCLKQDQAPSWFPLKFQFWSANQTSPHTYSNMGWEGLHKNLFYSKIAPLLAPSHPVFAGMNSNSLHLWDNYDGRVSDDVFVRPANVDKHELGNWRTLSSGTRREHASLAELFYGKGILLSCQLNIIDNLDNTQAKSLFVNMLNYLSDKQPKALNTKIAVRGSLSPAELSILTGASKEALHRSGVEYNDLMIAFKGADASEIKDWANKGGRVIVLSDSLSQTFEGVETSDSKEENYLATKITDHTLLQGVSSANFLKHGQPIIKNHFTAIPNKAKVILQGFSGTNFWRCKDTGPVMIGIPYGKGEILLSTIEIEKNASTSARELLSLILTNSGVNIPFAETSINDEIVIKKTVPITVDGMLNEWLEDMEDRNVTQYLHAQPVYLTSENIIEGPPEFDLNLSAINYFLWNEKALHIAGVVFGEEKTYETGIGYGSEKQYLQEIRYNNDVITISVKNKKAKILVNGEHIPNDLIGVALLSSKEMTDATELQFNYILASGKIASVDNLIGETFELMIPWEYLTSKPDEGGAKVLINLSSKGSRIQVPLAGDTLSKATWLDFKFDYEDY